MVSRIIDYLKKNNRIIVYSACGLGLSWIDLWRGIGNGAQWALAINCIGFCVFPIIALRLDWRVLLPKYAVSEKWQKLLRLSLYIWIIVFAIIAYPAFKHFAPGTDYDAQIATAIVNIGLYGSVVIRMYFFLFYERNLKEKNTRKLGAVFYLWLVFMLFSIISVSKFIWPLWFMVMFGSLYIVSSDKNETEEIIVGLANGMIIGFFWIQSRAFLYRPYDCGPRYYGHYTNPNVNAMFYLFTYVAWLTKLTYYRVKQNKKLYLFSFFMASSMWGFEFFTGCRSAWLAFAAVTVIYWFFESADFSSKIRFFFLRFALMSLMALVTFVPVFLCMRYIPPLRHHPIWYQGEYSENRVMSWDPIDSPKYESLSDILAENLGRLAFFGQKQTDDNDKSDEMVVKENHDHGVVFAEDGERVISYSCGIVPGSDDLHPLYIDIDYDRSFFTKALGIRYHIYQYVISNVKLLGNEEPYFSVWFTKDFRLGHTHNSILMIMYWFGPFAGISVVILLISACLHCVNKRKNRNSSNGEIVTTEFAFIALLAFIISGLTECTVLPGEMSLSIFFLSLLPLVYSDRTKRQKETKI